MFLLLLFVDVDGSLLIVPCPFAFTLWQTSLSDLDVGPVYDAFACVVTTGLLACWAELAIRAGRPSHEPRHSTEQGPRIPLPHRLSSPNVHSRRKAYL